MAVALADLYQQTGFKLGILRADQTLSAEDGDLITKRYTSLHDQLLGEHLATWAVDEELPEWAAPIVVDILAAMLVDEFGLEEPRRTMLRAEGALGAAPVSPAERKLRRQLTLPYVPGIVYGEYF